MAVGPTIDINIGVFLVIIVCFKGGVFVRRRDSSLLCLYDRIHYNYGKLEN
jgi:hypothetical protein